MAEDDPFAYSTLLPSGSGSGWRAMNAVDKAAVKAAERRRVQAARRAAGALEAVSGDLAGRPRGTR